MRVSYCAKCQYYERKTWSNYHIPKNYHPIGISHAYGYCKLYCMRCSEIKPCIYFFLESEKLREVKQ